MRSLVIVLLLAGCAKTAVRDDGRPTDTRCPSLDDAARKQIDALGGITLREFACGSGERCSEGPYDCRCEGPLGGAARPDWWECRRAREKRDGCADDQLIFTRGACATEGQRCNVPRSCGCSTLSEATCAQGHWQLEPCTLPCLAP